MYHDFTYEAALTASIRAQWQLDDVLAANQELDFALNFMPESLARTAALTQLSAPERRLLNHISAHQYLCIFGIVEEFILPFLLDHARPVLRSGSFPARAILNFATEEAKHIHLFKRFRDAFVRGFPVDPQIIGPSEAIGAEVLRHDPLAIGLVILMIEWMTQAHYLGSIRDDTDLDPLFKSLLKHHWVEEAQHARLDTLIVDQLGSGRSEREIDSAIDEFFEIGTYLDVGLAAQAAFNLNALERVIGRDIQDRDQIVEQQHQAARWTYIGSGMVHERFRATVEALSPRAAQRIADAAPIFS